MRGMAAAGRGKVAAPQAGGRCSEPLVHFHGATGGYWMAAGEGETKSMESKAAVPPFSPA